MWCGRRQQGLRLRGRWLGAVGVVVGLVVAVVGGGVAGAPVPASPTQPLPCVPAISTFQIVLPLPGLFLPLPSVRGVSEFEDLAPAPRGLDLPEAVDFRDSREGFNSFSEFALRRGSLYTRPRNSGATWRTVRVPDCLNGQIVAMSADSNMVVALDRNGWIYSLDNVLSGPLLWNWTRLFGAPIWLWPGAQVPTEARQPNKWAISHRMSTSFVDARGFTHPLTAGLVQLVGLTGGGSRIVFQDPWLPADHSYEIGGPLGGRFISESLTSSGSVTLVMNRFGDMYTRKYDLDLAGANHIPGRYTWQVQGPVPSAPDQLTERIDPRFAAISLPAQEWQPQPKIPGEVTARISIHDTGDRMEDRELQVEGRRAGRTGYWHKGLMRSEWQFTPTDRPLAAPVLAGVDPNADQSSSTLAAPSGLTFAGALPGGWTARTEHFDWAQTAHPLVLTSPAGHTYPVTMYTTDGLRLVARGPGLDDTPRTLEGAVDVRAAHPNQSPELSRFVRDTLSGREIFEVSVQATRSSLVIAPASPLSPPLATLTRR